MNDENIQDLIDKYFKGTISAAELQHLNKWLGHGLTKDIEVPSSEEAIRQRIKASVQQKVALQTSRGRRIPRSYYRVAAAIAVFIVAGLGLHTQRSYIRDLIDPVVYTSVEVPKGQVVQMRLPDGTHVWINAASVLKYPKKFNRNTREVYLQGEAFFDVTKSKAKPFIIHTGAIDVRVTGTSFNVKDYVDEKQAIVTVASGSVAVSEVSPEGKVLLGSLTPNEQVTFNKENHQHRLDTANAAAYHTWREGTLTFEDASFEEIATVLERWYDVKVVFSNEKIKTCRFRLSINKLSLSNALKLLSTVSNADYQVQGKTVIIKGNGCR